LPAVFGGAAWYVWAGGPNRERQEDDERQISVNQNILDAHDGTDEAGVPIEIGIVVFAVLGFVVAFFVTFAMMQNTRGRVALEWGLN